MRIGLPELIVIFVAVILLFGSKGLPDVARGLAEGIRLFKKALNGEDEAGQKENKNSEESK